MAAIFRHLLEDPATLQVGEGGEGGVVGGGECGVGVGGGPTLIPLAPANSAQCRRAWEAEIRGRCTI